jgi:sigma-E factor negative regulatory protein RseC
LATEDGIVTKISEPTAQTAWVKTVQSSACKSCSERHSCGQDSKGKEREVEAVNMVGARVGDRIQISIDDGALLKATFLLYVFPIICMLIGGLAGHRLGTGMGINPSPVSAVIAIICFLGAMLVVRMRAGRMALKLEYRPKITRIIVRATQVRTAAADPDGCVKRLAGNI